VEFGSGPVQSEPGFESMIGQARLAEALGFHALGAHEHDSPAMMYPDPLTRRPRPHTHVARLGTNMLRLPECR